MPARSAEEKAKRKLLHQQRQEARKLKKEKEEGNKKQAASSSSSNNEGKVSSNNTNSNESNGTNSSVNISGFSTLPEDPFHQILNYLPARDLGAFSMTCRDINLGMNEARTHHLFSRLQATNNGNAVEPGRLLVPIKICETENQVKELLIHALEGSGDTGRLVTKKARKGAGADEYIAYARFIEEAVQGRSIQVS